MTLEELISLGLSEEAAQKALDKIEAEKAEEIKGLKAKNEQLIAKEKQAKQTAAEKEAEALEKAEAELKANGKLEELEKAYNCSDFERVKEVLSNPTYEITDLRSANRDNCII